MEMDNVQIVLTILLGAAVANLIDEYFQLTPKLSDWLNELFD